MKRFVSVCVAFVVLMAGVALFRRAGVPVEAQGHRANCAGLPGDRALKGFLTAAPATGGDAGGLFHGQRMWGAIVNRE